MSTSTLHYVLPNDAANNKLAFRLARSRGPLKPLPANRGNSGRWEKWERMLFLQGLRRYGKGKWTKISEMISTRTVTQVKSHGQVVVKRMDEGENVFEELDHFEHFIKANEEKLLATPPSVVGTGTTYPISGLGPQDFDAAHILVVMRK